MQVWLCWCQSAMDKEATLERVILRAPSPHARGDALLFLADRVSINRLYGAYRCQENFVPIFDGGLGWLRRAWNSFYGVSCAVQRHSFNVRYGDRGSFERSIHASLPLFAEKNQSGLLDR